MCVVFLAIDQHPRWRIVLASNRDEFYARPTASASPWPDCPDVIAGRDLEAGGTWLGVTRDERWTVVTNVRDLLAHRAGARSRGGLAADFLCGTDTAEEYARRTFGHRTLYNPFNLLMADRQSVWYVSTHRDSPEKLGAGLYGLSNATLDVPWPKVTRGTGGLAEILHREDFAPEDLFALLADAEPAPDAMLPDTGVGLAKERMLSSILIASPDYGTRASSVLLQDRSGGSLFVERTVAASQHTHERTFLLD